ncbi:MAG: primosomal protein N' [Peptococcaceae bacterium]
MSKVAAVCINLTRNIENEVFRYFVPPLYQEKVRIGCRVLVPFGSQRCEGFVIELSETAAIKGLKEILGLVDEECNISQEMVKIALWVSRKYLSPLHKVLDYILPPYARTKKEKFIRLKEDVSLANIVQTMMVLDPQIEKACSFLKKGPQKAAKLSACLGNQNSKVLAEMEKKGLIESYYDFQRAGRKKELKYLETVVDQEEFRLLESDLKRAPRQAAILKYLIDNGPQDILILQENIPYTRSAVKALISKGYIREFFVEKARIPSTLSEFKDKRRLEFNKYQQEAIANITGKIVKHEFAAFLLHGVTGSGKTEVYLQCIRKCLELNKGAILLVPEISLTPQVIGRFKSVLGDRVAVLHSNLSQGERLDAWNSIRNGQSQVVVGVRSAVFAPVENLGLIIIDEEHETTYKQSEPDPRYHARDVAWQRSKLSNAVLVLGSATPSLESYYKARRGIYKLLEMPRRVTKNTLPVVEIVDLREEFREGNKSIFSRKLQESINTALAENEQIILFLNRRGFSTFVLCRECGQPIACKNCSISLTYHTFPIEMRCHYCNYSRPVPRRCPSCGSSFIRYFGTGTQQVETELLKMWPHIKITRMDVDTTQNKNSHQQLLAEFKRGATNILIGTQMITKGLDFANVTLVGVIAADTSLNLPDYTSGERTFQLLTQVAGRAGRGEKEGKVIIQTYNPQHYAVIAGKNQNYDEFYQQEIKVRELMNYPPFSALVRIVISDFQEQKVILCAERFVQAINERFPNEFEVLGPAQAPISKMKNRYRWQIILKGSQPEKLIKAAEHGYEKMNKGKTSNTPRIVIDVDPQSIL